MIEEEGSNVKNIKKRRPGHGGTDIQKQRKVSATVELPFLVMLFGKPITQDAFNLTIYALTILGTAAYRDVFQEVSALISNGH